MCEILHSIITESECKTMLGKTDRERKHVLDQFIKENYPDLS